MKNIFIVFIISILTISCSKPEPIIASLDKQSILVFNESLVSNPITTEDGFFTFTEKETRIFVNKISFEGGRTWQNNINEEFNFSPKVQYINTTTYKTPDKGILLSIVHTDTIKYKTLRHFVKYLKFDEKGNVLYNFDKIIINGVSGSEPDYENYNYFDTFESDNGEIVSFSTKYETITNEHIIGTIQITRYSKTGQLISNTEIEIDNVYEFWEILSFSDSEIKLLAENYGDINIEGYSSVFTLNETDGLISEKEIPYKGFPTFSSKFNDNFILIYNGYTSNQNKFIEIDSDGNVLSEQQINNSGKQFYCVSAFTSGNEIYFAGLTTNNPLELIKPSFTWAKLNESGFSYLGELRTMENAIAESIFKNNDGSLSIIGMKDSFFKENIILIKTKTDGTIVSDQ